MTIHPVTTVVALVLIGFEIVSLVSHAVSYLRGAIDRHRRIARRAGSESTAGAWESTPIVPR